LPRFDRPGHFAHSDRSDRNRGLGELAVISIVDDRTRLAYSELHAAENRYSTTATLRRAAAFFEELGCGAPQAVMSDNHKAYTSQRFQAELARLGARHIPIPPYTPRWNGKVERFQQTLALEWAHGRIWRSSLERPSGRVLTFTAEFSIAADDGTSITGTKTLQTGANSGTARCEQFFGPVRVAGSSGSGILTNFTAQITGLSGAATDQGSAETSFVRHVTFLPGGGQFETNDFTETFGTPQGRKPGQGCGDKNHTHEREGDSKKTPK
jgi:hypothetical protein